MKINKTNQLILIFLSSLFMNQSLNAEINKYIRYSHDNDINYGIVSNDMVFELTKAPYLGGTQTGKKIQLNNVQLLAPAEPSKVLAVGFNYHSHRGDLELPSHPPIFLKLPSSIIGPNENIIYHSGITDLHYEAELVAVIGKRASKISKEEASDYIFGVTAGNDVSARNWQAEDLQWFRGKASDTFSPLGPMIVSGLNYKDLLVESKLNGKTMQSQRTKDHIHDIDAIVSHISQTVTLEPGDVIYTGTPGTTSSMVPGDIIEITVEGVGILKNTISK
tara:strand:- start:8501 stop:9331 length:831 start_codon:yes stop_codon:yes gene_type:complete